MSSLARKLPALFPARELFVGRDAPLAQLAQHLRAARDGSMQSVLLEGEAGMGKTCLLQRFARSVAPAEALVLVGHGSTETGTPAFWPWIEIMGALFRARRPARGSQHVLRAFAPWLPGVGSEPTSSDTRASQPESELQVRNSLVQLVLDAASVEPLCVIIEDLHELDVSSLQVLRSLQRQLQNTRLLLIASLRRSEEHNPPLEQLTEVCAGFMQRVPLDGLGPVEVHTLMERALRRPVTKDLSRAVHERAEGNPLYVHAVVSTLAEYRAQSLPQAAALELPRSARLAGQRQLDGLSPDCRHVLRLAAVFGREFELPWLVRIAPMQSGCTGLHALLTEACHQRVLVHTAAPANYRFAHALLHEVLLSELDHQTRIQAHGRAALALEAATATDDARLECRIAGHWLELDEPAAVQRALTYSSRAAQAALARGAYAEAATAFAIAVRATRKQQASPNDSVEVQRRRGQLLVALGGAQWRSGRLMQAHAAYAEATRIADEISDEQLLADAQLESLGDILLLPSCETLANCERAALSSKRLTYATRIRLLARVGLEYWHGPARKRGLELIERAAEMGRDYDDPRVQLALLRAQRIVLPETTTFAERLAAHERRLQLAAQLQDSHEAAWSHAHVFAYALEFGELSRLEVSSQQLWSLVSRAGEPLVWWAHVLAATWVSSQGEFSEAERLVLEARRLSANEPHSSSAYLWQTAAIRQRQGRLQDALALRSSALQSPSAAAYATLAHNYHELGDVAQAHLAFQRASAHEPTSVYECCRLAEAAHALAETRVAQRCYQQLLPYRSRANAVWFSGISCTGAVARYAGLAALTAGHREQAIGLFQEAIAVNRRLGAMPALAESQLALARALDMAPASHEHIQGALRLAQSLGMTALAAQAQQLHDQQPAHKPNAQTREPPKHGHFAKRGELWYLAHAGCDAWVSDQKGMHYLAALLREPGSPKHVLELMGSAAGSADATLQPEAEGLRVGALETYEAALDTRSVANYRERLRQLANELREAEARRDLGRREKLAEEVEALREQLCAGVRGRQRSTERARKAVYNRLRQAIQHIEVAHAELAGHLVLTIKTGTSCVYRGGQSWQTNN